MTNKDMTVVVVVVVVVVVFVVVGGGRCPRVCLYIPVSTFCCVLMRRIDIEKDRPIQDGSGYRAITRVFFLGFRF